MVGWRKLFFASLIVMGTVVVNSKVGGRLFVGFCPGELLSDFINDVGGGLVFVFFCGGLLLEVLFLAWRVSFPVGAVLLELVVIKDVGGGLV